MTSILIPRSFSSATGIDPKELEYVNFGCGERQGEVESIVKMLASMLIVFMWRSL